MSPLTLKDTGRIHLARLGRNDIFGEMAVLCNLPRTADVRTRPVEGAEDRGRRCSCSWSAAIPMSRWE
ncbi:MAG: hypothetical protein U1E43_10595 [Rhodospirillales bacterium]